MLSSANILKLIVIFFSPPQTPIASDVKLSSTITTLGWGIFNTFSDESVFG